MRITTSITQTRFSSARAAKKVLLPLVLGKIINMAVVGRSYIDVTVATNEICSAVRYGNTTEATRQKLFKCFHGKCQSRYKHPQDLERHVATHNADRFECEMCDKFFSQKRLLKRHLVVHSNVCAYKCSNCKESFKHYNQLYRHRKRCLK